MKIESFPICYGFGNWNGTDCECPAYRGGKYCELPITQIPLGQHTISLSSGERTERMFTLPANTRFNVNLTALPESCAPNLVYYTRYSCYQSNQSVSRDCSTLGLEGRK